MTYLAAYYRARLAAETDPSDVYAAQKTDEEFVLVDVRSDEAWSQGRIPGAIHMPYRQIAERAPREIDPALPVVVYCWSPGCNAGVKGALEFAMLGYAVKEVIGGFEYWAREGKPVENDEGAMDRTLDPHVMVVSSPAPPSVSKRDVLGES